MSSCLARTPERARLTSLTCLAVALMLAGVGSRAIHATAAPAVATYEFTTPGWATFGVALPQGAATGGLVVEGLETQTDVKTTWPDGSIRFAIVTVDVPTAGTHAIMPGPAAGGGGGPAWPTATTSFVIGADTWVADLPAAPPADMWLDGPLVSEGRHVIVPVSVPGGVPHPFLRVIFDVRAYTGGGHRVDVTVENTLNVATAGAVTYDVAITVGGLPVFAQAGVQHGYLARWRQVFNSVGLANAHVAPDMTPFIAAGALPEYLPTVNSSSACLPTDTDPACLARFLADPALNSAERVAKFQILGTGDLHIPMNDHGGRPEIAPYPDWIAQFLVHKRPDLLAYMLRHGELGGSFGIHILEGDGSGILTIDRHPYFWLDYRASLDPPAQGMIGTAVEADNSHQPSLAYVPYLITGDRFFLDEMKYWANYTLLVTNPEFDLITRGPNGSEGLLTLDSFNEVRGIAWALRNLGDAAAYTPDADPDRAYFAEKAMNNLKWLQDYATTFSSGPLNTLFTGRRPEDNDFPPKAHIAPWEHHYVAWTVDHLMKQGFSAGTAIRDRIAEFQLKLFTTEGDPDGYPRAYAGPGTLGIGTKIADDTYDYYTTLRQGFESSFSCDPTLSLNCTPDVLTSLGTSPLGGWEPPLPFSGRHGVSARLMLLISKRENVPGADTALTYLMSLAEPGEQTMMDDVNQRAGWALAEEAPVADPNTAPVVTNPGNQTSAEGASINLTITATDADGDTLTFSATGLPPGLSISATGEITGTLGFDAAGTHTTTVTADDGNGGTTSESFTWNVTNVNRAPTVNNPGTQTSSEGPAVSLTISANDPDGDTLTFTVAGLPPGLTISAAGEITGTLGFDAAGSYTTTVMAEDGNGGTAAETFTWNVTNVNRAPTVNNPGTQTNDEGQAVSLTITGSDPDGDPLTFTATGLPPGLGISASGDITGTLGYDAAGTYNPTVTANDGKGGTASETFSWTVNDVNRAPTVNNPGTQTNDEGQAVSLTITGSDPDGDTLTFTATGLPPGLNISASGQITGTLGYDAAGTYNPTVTANDGRGGTGSTTFSWTVNNVNRNPAVNNPGTQTSNEGDAVSLIITGTDPDGDALTFSATGLPPNLSISPTGVISGTLAAGSAGIYNPTITALDGKGGSATATFQWTVTTGDRPPTITNPGDQTNTSGDVVLLKIHANDPDGDRLTFHAEGLPPGLVMSHSGLIAGIVHGPGIYDVTVEVTANGKSASTSFKWTVLEEATDWQPDLENPGNQHGKVGQHVSLKLRAKLVRPAGVTGPPKGGPVMFKATGLPPGLFLNTFTGRISGMLMTAGVYHVTATAFTTGGRQDSETFTWTVERVNHRPKVKNPGHQSNRRGDMVSLQIEAFDPDGDVLRFNASGLPDGLTINPLTGLITGQISSSESGWHWVEIEVTDGELSKSVRFGWRIYRRRPNNDSDDDRLDRDRW